MVDGQEGCFNNVVTLKFYEAQKYATTINYSVHSCNFIVGERWLQSLPEKERNALIRAGKEAMLYERNQGCRHARHRRQAHAVNTAWSCSAWLKTSRNGSVSDVPHGPSAMR